MPDSPRIEELKRRVLSDPASIAFAALAEEYRRAERFQDAIDTCTAGLVRHPSYLSAHVTLGRALIEVGRLKDAREELEYVLKLAPENLAAIRGLAEIHHRFGEDNGDHEHVVPPPAAAADEAVAIAEVQAASGHPAAIAHETIPASVAGQPTPLGGDQVVPIVEAAPARPQATVIVPDTDREALAGLEQFLNDIVRARNERAAAR